MDPERASSRGSTGSHSSSPESRRHSSFLKRAYRKIRPSSPKRSATTPDLSPETPNRHLKTPTEATPSSGSAQSSPQRQSTAIPPRLSPLQFEPDSKAEIGSRDQVKAETATQQPTEVISTSHLNPATRSPQQISKTPTSQTKVQTSPEAVEVSVSETEVQPISENITPRGREPKVHTSMAAPTTPLRSPQARGFEDSPGNSLYGSFYSNGVANGANGASRVASKPGLGNRQPSRGLSGSGLSNRSSRYSSQFGGAGSYKLSTVADTAASLTRKSASELGAGPSGDIVHTTFVQFIENIRAERLSSLPHKGSRWDKVLIRAQYFAEKLQEFDNAIKAFAIDSTRGAQIGFGHAKLLLELGHENSEALDTVFSFLYKNVLTVSSLLGRTELLAVTSETREQLTLIYADLLTLVTEIAIRLHKTVHGMISGHTSLDIHHTFGATIETIKERRAKIIEEIWFYQIESDGLEIADSIPVDHLTRWLSPPDHVLASLSRDHTTFADHQAEFTCLWFQKPLARFVQGSDTLLLVKGKAGSGKTSLAASVAERLQRPVGRQSFHTVFTSISSAMPTQATGINVAKSLLFQLMSLRAGNIRLYHAVASAYEKARTAPTTEEYETYLWNALAEALRNPLDNAPELVIVLDGVDEIADGPEAAQALFGRLTQIIAASKKSKLIVLSQEVTIPQQNKGVSIEITKEDIRDDIYAVALRALYKHDGFNGVDGTQQESILHRIVEASNGSFNWAALATEVLVVEGSKTPLTQNLEALEKQPSVEQLVHRVITATNPSTESLTVLNWLLESERPFTLSELRTLFSIDISRNTTSDKGLNIPQLVKPLSPLLSVHDDIVRVRHPEIMTAARNLIKTKVVKLPITDAETDLLYRTLSYAKSVLTDRREPTFGDFGLAPASRLFRQHVLLEYVVRYWPRHLQQSKLNSKQPNGEFTVTNELTKVFPNTALLPLLEFQTWEAEQPPQTALNLHVFTSRIRRQILTEKSPATFQTYINVAVYYTILSQTTEAVRNYHRLTKLSRTLFSDTHDLTVESCIRFLQITETLTFTSRTDTFTLKEEVLTILITVYTKLYGSTSEQVVELQTILANLYVSINEHDKAQVIWKLLRTSSEQVYGGDDEEDTRDVPEHLRIHLGKGRDQTGVTGYDKPLFTDEDGDEVIEVFDIAQIEVLIKRAEAYLAKGDAYRAELTFIELWQQISHKSATTRSVEWHEKHVDVALAYSKFLKTQKRETESTSVLTTVWQQYQHHELSYTENIISRLTTVAKTLKASGHYSAALSIFQYASSYYKSVKQTQSRSFTEIEEEVAITSTEVVKQSLESTTVTESSNKVSGSTFLSVFRSMISNHTKTVDKTTVALAQKLVVQHIEEQKYEEAIEIINLTLKRTWSSFFNEIQSVTLTTSFQEESIQLVERLAESYFHLRQLEKVEDIHVRLFRAVLVSKNVSPTLFERAQSLLISFYDKHGYPDKAIAVFQEVLIVRRRTLGPAHKSTIDILYILGSRCRSHARNHPYWIEYYQQIITALNKDGDVCHPDAFGAIEIVGTYYWEDRRYSEAVIIYSVLWNTFISKTTEYKHFKDTKFVQTLFERYFQCLEETRAEHETLIRVATQYREKSVSIFGAKTEISVQATLTLARVYQRSEEHSEKAIALYEEASSNSTSTTHSSTIKESLSRLYTKQITRKSTSTISAETIDRAISIYSEQYAESRSKHGYSSLTTLSHQRELLTLYSRQQKTEQITKELSQTVSEIVTKESSSERLIQSSIYLAETFQSLKLEHEAREMIEELTLQIIAKHTRKSSKFNFNLTTVSRSALVFLTGLEYNLRTDSRLTFTQIMSDFLSMAFQYDHFRRLVKNDAALDKIIISAAPLRIFLLQKKQDLVARMVEEDIVNLFVKRDTAKLKLRSQQSPGLFIIAVLDHLGRKKSTSFVRSVIHASNDNVRTLTNSKRFNEAYDVGDVAFLFAKHHNGYVGPNAISAGFKLALLLSGRAGAGKSPDAETRKVMLALSNKIIKQILEICKTNNVNFAQVQLAELNQLSELLGDHEDYATLEWLLSSLWNTRDAQKSWPPYVLLQLGRRLIAARYLAGNSTKAVRLCEDIAYNMRRVHGVRHPASLETYELLAQLYTSVGQQYQASAEKGDKAAGSLATQHFRKAFFIHEELLKTFIYEGTAEDDDDDELESTAALLSQYGGSDAGSMTGGGAVQSPANDSFEAALYGDAASIDANAFIRKQLHLLKLAYQRLGTWPKNYAEYERLNADAFRRFPEGLKGAQGVEKWVAKGFGGGKAEGNDGVFGEGGPQSWEFVTAPGVGQGDVAKVQKVVDQVQKGA